VKAAVASSFGLSQVFAWCELELEPLMRLGRKQLVEPIPEYQLIIRDVSLEIDEAIQWQMIERILRRQKAVFSVEFLNTFADAKLHQVGRRVLSCRLRLDAGPQPSAERITQLIKRCYAALKHSLPDEAELSIR
jgi:phenylalanyl-tRNA synthetase beta subunit